MTITGIIISVCIGLLLLEIGKWLPFWSRKIAILAANRAPKRMRRRLKEEFLADLDGLPGPIAQFGVAIGFVVSSAKIRMPTYVRYARMKTGRLVAIPTDWLDLRESLLRESMLVLWLLTNTTVRRQFIELFVITAVAFALMSFESQSDELLSFFERLLPIFE